MITGATKVLAYHHRAFLSKLSAFPAQAHPADPFIRREDSRALVVVWFLTEKGWRRFARGFPRNVPNEKIRQLWFEFRGRLARADPYGNARNAVCWLANNAKR